MNWQNYIERDPHITLGEPVFKGTRLTVEFVLERLGHGATIEELMDSCLDLRPEHIRAAQAYAAAVPRHEDVLYPAHP